jgi:hypothetical protein
MDKFDVTKFRAALFEPLAKGQPSVLNMMRNEGLISNAEVKNLLSIIRPMEKIEKAMGTKQSMDEILQGADAVTELAMRVVGARIGSTASGGGPGSLIAASAGSKAVRNIFDKMPTMMIRGIIEEATKDPQMMAMLLKKGVTEGDRIQMARQLHGYLGAAGLNYAEFEEPVPTPAPAPRGTSAQQQLRSLPPAPAARGVPGLTQPPAGQAPKPAAPAPGPQSAAPSESRKMLASLFPEDRMLAMPQNFNQGGEASSDSWENYLADDMPDESFSDSAQRQEYLPLDVRKLIDAGVVRITQPGDGQGGYKVTPEPWNYSVVTAYNDQSPNSYTRNWPSKPEAYEDAATSINEPGALYDGKYRQILWSAQQAGLSPKDVFLRKKR